MTHILPSKLSKRFVNLYTFVDILRIANRVPFIEKQIKHNRFIKLKSLLMYSYRTFDFYKDLMDQARFDPYKFHDMRQFTELPIIDKQMYRDFTESVVRLNPDLYATYYVDGTSGSTGLPLTIYRTWRERAYMIAKYMRTLFLNGMKIRYRTFSIPSPHRITARDAYLQKFGILPRYTVAYTDTVEKMVKGYIQSNADVLYANKSQLVQMAIYINESGIEIRKPVFYLCAAETLDDNSRKTVMDVFGPHIINIYGAVEFNNLAFQLLGEKHLVFNHDTNYLELDDHGNINEKKGYSIITDFNIFSFPLIRYHLGDWIETEESDGLPVIRDIRGRMDDWVYLPDGRSIPFHFFYEIMARHVEVRQFKIIQKSQCHIEVQVVPEKRVDIRKLKKSLINELKTEVDQNTGYTICYKEAIQPDPNGKLQMVVSEIA